MMELCFFVFYQDLQTHNYLTQSLTQIFTLDDKIAMGERQYILENF